MNYQLAIKDLMEINGYTAAYVARLMNVSHTMVRNWLLPYRFINGVRQRNGLTVATYLRLAKALNCRVILEFRDPTNLSRMRRWKIDNSDYYGPIDDGRVPVMDDFDEPLPESED